MELISKAAFDCDRKNNVLSMRWWAGIWVLLGKQSLAIYLLHYFFLFNLGSFRPWLESMDLAFAPTIVFSFAWASVIIAMVLCLNAIISRSKFLSFALTGTQTKQKPGGITK